MAIDPVVVETGTRRRRNWLVPVAAGVGLMGLAVWLVAGRTPDVTAGYFSEADPEAHLVPAGIGETVDHSVVVDPSDGTNDAIWSFTNGGRLPITVSAADPLPGAPVVRVGGVFVVDPADPLKNADSASGAVRLAPGEVVGVKISVGFGCASWVAGTGVAIEAVPLRVTTLGITRTVAVTGPMTVGVQTTSDVHRTDCG
jgi:hypothetical protein